MRRKGKCFLLIFASILLIPALITTVNKPVEAVCAPEPGVNSLTTLASGNSLYLMWEQDTGYINSTVGGTHTLYFKKSSDGGKSFGNTISLYKTSSGCSIGSQMVIGGNGKEKENVYIAWHDSSGRILLTASNDGGASFGDTLPISLGNYTGAYQIIANTNNSIYIAFSSFNESTSSYEIFFKKSSDGGKSFGNPVKLSNNSSEDSSDPHLAASGQNIYVVWSEAAQGYDCGSALGPKPECPSKIMFTKSTDGGRKFNDPLSLSGSGTCFRNQSNGSNNATCITPQNPDIQAAGSDVYVTWRDGSCVLCFAHSADYGKTFSQTADLFAEFSQNTILSLYDSPYMVAYDSTAYVAWMANSGTGYDFYLIKTADGGNHFYRIEAAIPRDFGNNAYPIPKHLAIARNGELYFGWTPNADGHTILFQAVLENATASANPSLIYSSSNTPYLEWYPQIAASDVGNVYVLWQNSTNSQMLPGNPQQQLVIRASADAGQSFDKVERVQNILSIPEFASSLSALVMTLGIGGAIGAGMAIRHRL